MSDPSATTAVGRLHRTTTAGVVVIVIKGWLESSYPFEIGGRMRQPAIVEQCEANSSWHTIADCQPGHSAAVLVRRKTRGGHEMMGILSWHAPLQIWVEPAGGRWWYDDDTKWATL